MRTLSQVRASPTLSPLDLRAVRVPEIMSRYNAARTYLAGNCHNEVMARPEHEAISFYLANAAYAQVLQRVAPDALLNEYEGLITHYQRVVRVESVRLFFYLMLICTRESRHIHSDGAFFASLEARYGCSSFAKTIRGMGSMAVADRLIKQPPDVTLGAYTDHLVAVFDEGADKGLFNGGYGGKAWAGVAKVLRNFVHGLISAELLLDTGFCLAHNNGPIFNKDMLYVGYDQHELIRILDVQRAGMIPQFVGSKLSKFVLPEHVAIHGEMQKLLGSAVQGSVDWNKVEALGAVQSYTAEKKLAAAMKPKVAVAPVSKGVFITPVLSVQPVKVARLVA